ncbi:MAG: hypothetical protein ACK2U5_04565 [Candidatus Promineifilaceae bacterium]|jgi:hypothetical protein
MRDRDWVRFLLRAAVTVVKYMVLGALIMGTIGVLIAAAAAIFANGGPLTVGYVAGIAGNYVKVGLFGGGIVGLLYGLLAQGSYS